MSGTLYPFTVNGNVYTEDMFLPYNYRTTIPKLFADLAAVSGNIGSTLISVMAALSALQLQTFPTVLVTSATALTVAAHNSKLVQVQGAGEISAPWASTGIGFSCLILNLRPASIAIQPTGMTLRSPTGHNRVQANGLAMLICFADGSNPHYNLVGQTEA